MFDLYFLKGFQKEFKQNYNRIETTHFLGIKRGHWCGLGPVRGVRGMEMEQLEIE